MKVLSLFSGIGAFEKALDNLEIPYELVGYCEIDKYASKSYSAIHNVPESMNLGDITKVDEKTLPKDIDLLTYGFPCQDISIAGKMQGLFDEDGISTRSGLFFEALRIIEETQPRVAIAENVKNLTGKTFKDQFKIVLDSLELAGYINYWAVLNAKDYGVPQSRERVFIVSIRKDIDIISFKFPEGFPLEIRLKDILEDEVDEKYYLSDKTKDYLATITMKEESRVKDNFIEEPAVKQIGNCCPTKTRDNPNQGRIYDSKGLAPCLNQMGGGNRQPFIIEDFYKNRDDRIYEDVAPTLRSERIGLKVAESNLRIRKLTPKECFRLMGFDDADFEKAEAVNSNTQLYKQAGNSIVVPVVEYIIQALLECGALKKEKEKQNEMELRIEPYATPEQPIFNYEELKEMLLQKASHYEAMVYTDDQIQDAKADRANLNKLKKALNDERIRREKEYMEKFNVFKAQVKELVDIIDKAVANTDRQVKEFEESKKAEKMEAIKEYWTSTEIQLPIPLTLEQIFNEKWLNASVKMPAIVKEITEKLEQIENDLAVIENLPAYAFEAKEVYNNTLDLGKAVSEANRLREMAEKKAAWEAEQEKRKAEAEAAATPPDFSKLKPGDKVSFAGATETAADLPNEPKREWVKFQAYMTIDEAKALGMYMRNNGIQYKAV